MPETLTIFDVLSTAMHTSQLEHLTLYYYSLAFVHMTHTYQKQIIVNGASYPYSRPFQKSSARLPLSHYYEL